MLWKYLISLIIAAISPAGYYYPVSLVRVLSRKFILGEKLTDHGHGEGRVDFIISWGGGGGEVGGGGGKLGGGGGSLGGS